MTGVAILSGIGEAARDFGYVLPSNSVYIGIQSSRKCMRNITGSASCFAAVEQTLFEY